MRLATLWRAFLCSGVVCIDMQLESPELTTTACAHEKVLRVDIRTPSGNSPVWLIDFDKSTSTFITPATSSYRTAPLDASVRALRKQPKALEAQQKETRARSQQARTSTVNPKDPGADGSADCRWHVIKSGGDSAEICTRDVGPEIAKEVVRLAGLVRATQKKQAPLVLQGLPLLNVDFPIYDAKGLVAANQLPVLAKLPGQTLRFGYRLESLPDDWFTVPAGFTRVTD